MMQRVLMHCAFSAAGQFLWANSVQI